MGAGLGVIVGGGVGAILSLAFLRKPESSVDLVIENATEQEAENVITQESQALLDELARWRRIAHAMSAAFATAGAATGAYIGASPHQKQRAAIGAAIGTGGIRSLNVALNPAIGAPGLVSGAAGAWIGAQSANR